MEDYFWDILKYAYLIFTLYFLFPLITNYINYTIRNYQKIAYFTIGVIIRPIIKIDFAN